MLKNQRRYRKSHAILAGCLFSVSLLPSLAYAEFSGEALVGIVNYNTAIKGDAVYGFGGPGMYYQHPADAYSTHFSGGVTGRYMHAFNPRFALGVEAGYIFLGQDTIVNRASALLPDPTWVENFRTKSVGMVLTNLVAKWVVIPDVSFSLFGGPAWLNTNYTANDFHDTVERRSSPTYQKTGDLGVEAAWEFTPNCAVGMRFDYIFNTGSRTVATVGSFGDPLLVNNTAQSNLTMLSATLRFIIPEGMVTFDQ